MFAYILVIYISFMNLHFLAFFSLFYHSSGSHYNFKPHAHENLLKSKRFRSSAKHKPGRVGSVESLVGMDSPDAQISLLVHRAHSQVSDTWELVSGHTHTQPPSANITRLCHCMALTTFPWCSTLGSQRRKFIPISYTIVLYTSYYAMSLRSNGSGKLPLVSSILLCWKRMIMDAIADLGVIYFVHLFPISARLNKFFILSFVAFSSSLVGTACFSYIYNPFYLAFVVPKWCFGYFKFLS